MLRGRLSVLTTTRGTISPPKNRRVLPANLASSSRQVSVTGICPISSQRNRHFAQT